MIVGVVGIRRVMQAGISKMRRIGQQSQKLGVGS